MLAAKTVMNVHTLRVAQDHPAFSGHFPGMPVLPGAVLLDEALHIVEMDLALDLVEWQISMTKFLEPVRPGDALTVEHVRAADTIRFAVRVADHPVLAGTLKRVAADGRDDA